MAENAGLENHRIKSFKNKGRDVEVGLPPPVGHGGDETDACRRGLIIKRVSHRGLAEPRLQLSSV